MGPRSQSLLARAPVSVTCSRLEARAATLPGLVAAPELLLQQLSTLVQGDDLLHLGVEPNAGEPYGRRILHRDAFGEVMLATWSGLMPCAAHDHGRARGAVLIIAGDFQEVRYQLRDGQLVSTQTREHAGGSLLCVDPDTLHAMFPRGRGVTLHIYAPGITGMRVFDTARSELVVVTDDHGAWLPHTAREAEKRVLHVRGQAHLDRR